MKHMVSTRAVCPMYKHEDSQVIYCEGVVEGTVTHLAFASKTDALDYKREFCKCQEYAGCPIYKMLEKLYK